jgi:hypothetical protein
MADGAVRPAVSGLLTPKAAHNRFERTWGDKVSALKARDVLRSFKTCMSGRPPSICGFGRGMDATSCEKTTLQVKNITEMRTNHIQIVDLIFIITSL